MRPSAWDSLWLVIVMMIAAVPFVLLATLGAPPPDPAPHPIALNELALAIKQADITSIEVSDPHGQATDRFGNTFAFQLQPATDALDTQSSGETISGRPMRHPLRRRRRDRRSQI